MVVRTYLGNTLMAYGRKMARADGRELKVELSEHAIDVEMVRPNQEELAWDPSMYRRGNVFVAGYANPIKPEVDYHETLDEPDEVDVESSEVAEDDADVRMISSPRYQEYMRQDLVESLLNPREQWKLIVYGIIGLGVLQFMAIIVTMFTTGAF